jgi:nucleoside-diphosphate-sugar epimerase
VKVLITGASGFLGSWFLNDYIQRNEGEIWSIDIQPHPAGIPVDQQDMVAWLDDFDEDVDIAFHFAAPVGGRMKIEYDPMYNADAFRLDSAFFRWAVKHAKLAVYPSSSAIYPVSLQQAGATHELFEPYADPRKEWLGAPDELYGMTKLAGEYMAWKAASKHGLDVLCIRPFSGYGPGQSFDYPVPSIIKRAVAKEDPLVVWGSGQTRDFVYVTDIVEATMHRIDEGVTGYQVMNIASGVSTSFRQIAQHAAAIVDYRPDIIEDPSKPIGVMHRWGNPRLMERYFRLTVPLIKGLRWTVESIQNPKYPDGAPQLRVEVDA